MNKDKLTRAGLEPATSGLAMPGLYQVSYLALHWRSPYCVNIFVGGGGGGGASQKSWNHLLPFSHGSRPSYDTTWEKAVGDAP